MKTFTARTLVEFVKIIDGLKADEPNSLWYRGQSNASHQLIPGALRNIHPSHDHLGEEIDDSVVRISSGGIYSGPDSERMLQEFKQLARPFLEQQPLNDFEWMFIAQHHGLPTRLLDWSTNALVALFFAAQGAPARKGNGIAECERFEEEHLSDEGFAVFSIEPSKINEKTVLTARTIDIASYAEDWGKYIAPMSKDSTTLPVCITAPHMTTRIRAQSGAFTLHGAQIPPLDYYTALQDLIIKIFIPYTATRDILASLARIGINQSFIYPSLDSITKDIASTANLRYASSRSKKKVKRSTH
ncbi:FRG domain-containing protein [Pseudomonas sp. CFBP 13711]|uniref:FRG domain-containing protein n=1 Tax=unclassified Pseudomonas TaxID=196821 RepID=UPI00177B8A9C|nr:FRG domain-containing protein [Pseudomonas sp. CFBP 13711]MBD8711928.1 FRG domain-containing protein [Pseudomonas sp. CFBP 13715]